MTTKQQEVLERLQREFEVCDKHLLRIEDALASIRIEFPLDTENYATLNSEQIRCLDQFIFRFSKFQDAIGTKIFRLTLHILGEDVSSLPLRDVLNLLERYNLINSAEEWQYMRELRNTITHEYSLDVNDIVDALNELIIKLPELKEIYHRLKAVPQTY